MHRELSQRIHEEILEVNTHVIYVSLDKFS